MSIMNIGERDLKKANEGGNPTPRQGKKMLGSAARPLSPSRLTRAKGRDTLLEDELKQMNLAVKERGEENFLHFGLERSEAKAGGKGRGEGRNLKSEIFAGPRPNPQPVLRIRPDVPEDDLKKIYAGEDKKKAQVAANMAQAEDMLDKMVNNNFPIQRKPQSPPRKKKTVGETQQLTSQVEPAMQVEGFAGMGARSKPAPRSGPYQGVLDQKVTSNIPSAGSRTSRHNYNAITGAAPGEVLKGDYQTSTSAVYVDQYQPAAL